MPGQVEISSRMEPGQFDMEGGHDMYDSSEQDLTGQEDNTTEQVSSRGK